jgi:hypothetical protein
MHLLDFLVQILLSSFPRFDCPLLGRQANETLAALGEHDNGGSCPCTFRVLDDAGSLARYDGDATGGCLQVNTDNWAYKTVNITRKKNDM